MPDELAHGAPDMRTVTFDILKESLRRGWADMKRAPVFGAIFASTYVVIGLILMLITYATGQTYWLVFAAVGFSLVGPFAAVGLYEVSRRLEQGRAMDIYKIFGVVLHQDAASYRRSAPSSS